MATAEVDLALERAESRERLAPQEELLFLTHRARTVLMLNWNATEAAIRESIEAHYPKYSDDKKEAILQAAYRLQNEDRRRIDPSTVHVQTPEYEPRKGRKAKPLSPVHEEIPEARPDEELSPADLEAEGDEAPEASVTETATPISEEETVTNTPAAAEPPSAAAQARRTAEEKAELRKKIRAHVKARLAVDPSVTAPTLRREVNSKFGVDIKASNFSVSYFGSVRKELGLSGKRVPRSAKKATAKESRSRPAPAPGTEGPHTDPSTPLDEGDPIGGTHTVVETINGERLLVEEHDGEWWIRINLRRPDLHTAAKVMGRLFDGIERRPAAAPADG